MSLLDELRQLGYVNDSGIVTVLPNTPAFPGEGNGLLQTGLAYCIAAGETGLTKEDKARIVRLTEACKHEFYPLLWRSPYKKNPGDNEQHDDYWGWLAACYHAGHYFPGDFYKFGEDHGWIIDVRDPRGSSDLNYYFGRFLGFVPFAKMARLAREPTVRLSVLEHLQVALAILIRAFDIDESDGCMRDFCLISVARKESFICKLASLLWYRRVRKKYGSVGAAFASYFQSENHPVTKGNWQ